MQKEFGKLIGAIRGVGSVARARALRLSAPLGLALLLPAAHATTAVAFGETSGKFGYAVNQPGKEAASRAAIEDCRKRGGGKDCKVFKLSDEVGYGALYAACVGGNCGFVSAMTGRKTRDAAHVETERDCKTYYQVASCMPLADWEETSSRAAPVVNDESTATQRSSKASPTTGSNTAMLDFVQGLPDDFDNWIPLSVSNGTRHMNPKTRKLGKNLAVETIETLASKSDTYMTYTYEVDCATRKERGTSQVMTFRGKTGDPKPLSEPWSDYMNLAGHVCPGSPNPKVSQKQGSAAKAESNTAMLGFVRGLPAGFDDWTLISKDDGTLHLSPKTKKVGKYVQAQTISTLASKQDSYMTHTHEIECKTGRGRAIASVLMFRGDRQAPEKISDDWSDNYFLAKYVCPATPGQSAKSTSGKQPPQLEKSFWLCQFDGRDPMPSLTLTLGEYLKNVEGTLMPLNQVPGSFLLERKDGNSQVVAVSESTCNKIVDWTRKNTAKN